MKVTGNPQLDHYTGKPHNRKLSEPWREQYLHVCTRICFGLYLLSLENTLTDVRQAFERDFHKSPPLTAPEMPLLSLRWGGSFTPITWPWICRKETSWPSMLSFYTEETVNTGLVTHSIIMCYCYWQLAALTEISLLLRINTLLFTHSLAFKSYFQCFQVRLIPDCGPQHAAWK